jgi:ubiquinone/menaquinone biosynthesis C-methylase UbiE
MEIKKEERDFHNSWGLGYELRWVKHPRYEQHYKRIVSRVRGLFRANPLVVVDIGCGTGRCSLLFVASGDIVVGLDLSRELLKIFRAKIHKSENIQPQVELVICDAENLPLQRGFADLVTFWGTLHHLPDKPKALAEATSLLKWGGVLTLHEPNLESCKLPLILGRLLNSMPYLLWKLIDHGKDNSTPSTTHYEQLIRLSEVVEFAKKCDLEIVEATTVWFFASILLEFFPLNVCSAYYSVANRFDEFIEKHLHNRAGAVFIVARCVKSQLTL